jgi:hypothetical protein
VDWPGNQTAINVTAKVTTEQAKSKRRVCSMLVESGARHRAFAPTANKYMSGTPGSRPGKRTACGQLKAQPKAVTVSQSTVQRCDADDFNFWLWSASRQLPQTVGCCLSFTVRPTGNWHKQIQFHAVQQMRRVETHRSSCEIPANTWEPDPFVRALVKEPLFAARRR